MNDDRTEPDADRRILVVDDDKDFADTLVHLLNLDGFEVRPAYSMAAAKQALIGFAPRIALIDIRIAEESGLDLVSEIKAAHPEISCVMMTAYASVDTAVAALQDGAYDYLQKPFYTQDLLSTINRCIERDALVRDRDRAEAALRDQNLGLEALNTRLRSLVSSMQTLSGSSSIEELCRTLASLAVALAAAERGTVSLRLSDGETIEISAEDGGGKRDGQPELRPVARRPDPIAGQSAAAELRRLELPLLSVTREPMGSVQVEAATDRPLAFQDRELLEILVSYASEVIHLLQALDHVSSSEARLRDIIDYSPSMISLQDLDGRFLVVNKRFEEWLGVPGDRAVGSAAVDILAPGLAGIFYAGQLDADEWRGERHEEVAVDLADGSVHTLLLTRFPVLAPDGRPLSVGTIATDVTAHRLAEGQLRQAQKMEALGQLTGGVAHDFNNLLAVISGNLTLAREEIAGQGELAEILEDAFDAARTGAELTHRLLAFGRQQTLQPQRVDSRELVMKMSRVLARTLGETIDIVAEPDEDLWPITVDRSQLETCLLNLALNGRDAMSGGGQLRITARNAELVEPGPPGTGRTAIGQYVLIAVADTGSGMEDDVARRAVQPFFTTKSAKQGSGLGLSMVDGFVEQSGGRLEISSSPGGGTTVSVYLPRHAEHDSEREPIEVGAPGRGGRGERILVVEDQPKVRRLAERILTRLGYEVLQSDTAAGALDILAGPADIDLLFTDVVLPGGMSGIELADAARQERPGLRVLYTSGYAAELVLGKNRADHEALLVGKPFQSEDLARMVRYALDQRR